MKDTPGTLHPLSHSQITRITDDLLAIPKHQPPCHPAPQRTSYSNILEWLTHRLTTLTDHPPSPQQAQQQQQQAILATLSRMVEMTRKECIEKSQVLQMVMQYFESTLHAYGESYLNTSNQLKYQYQRHTVRMEKEYVTQLQQLQRENEEYKMDKEHRWRNMYMLIKDNRILRKQHKKIMKAYQQQVEKNKVLVLELLEAQTEHEKDKLRLACLENDQVKLQNYMQTKVRMMELENKMKKYPSQSKRLLRNQLQEIQNNQINTLNQQLDFFIKAIEETGEIVEEVYDDDKPQAKYQFNISTQTEQYTDDKGVNTHVIRMVDADNEVHPRQLIKLRTAKRMVQETVEPTTERSIKRSTTRESKQINFMNQSFSKTMSVLNRTRNRSNKRPYLAIYDNLNIFIHAQEMKNTSPSQSTVKQRTSMAVPSMSNFAKTHSNSKRNNKLLKDPVKGLPVINTEKEFEEEDSQEVQYCESCTKRELRRQKKPFRLMEEVDYCFDPTWNRPDHSRLKKGSNLSRKMLKTSTDIGLLKQSKSGAYEKDRTSQLLPKQQSYNNNLTINIKDIAKAASKKALNLKRTQTLTDQQQFQISKGIKKPDVSIKQIASNELETEETQFMSYLTPSNPAASSNKKSAHAYDATSSVRSNSQQKTIRSKITAATVTKRGITQNTQRPNNNQVMPPIKKMLHKRASTENENILDEISKENMADRSSKKLFNIKSTSGLGSGQKTTLREQRSKDETFMRPTLGTSKSVGQIDFGKGFEKMMRNIESRRSQLTNNAFTLKAFLVSYFKCHYGKQVYSTFLNYLGKTSTSHEIKVCFSRLLNSRTTQAYLIDLFKAFVAVVSRCYAISQSPLSAKVPEDLLKFVPQLFLNPTQTQDILLEMRLNSCQSLLGCFNFVQYHLRRYALGSELFEFINSTMIQAEDEFDSTFIEELTYFMKKSPQLTKHLLRVKSQLGSRVSTHRLCIFSYKNNWKSLLQLTTTIEQEYKVRVGQFDPQQSLKAIVRNSSILKEFKQLDRSFQYWLECRGKYAQSMNYTFLKLIELNIVEYRLRTHIPLSQDLKLLQLVAQGLQKRQIVNELQAQAEKGATQ